MEMIKEDVGKRITELRKLHNLTMDELAKRIGVGGRSTINGWEKGRSLPTNDYLQLLSDVLNVPIDFLKYGSLNKFLSQFLTKDVWQSDNPYKSLEDTIWKYVLIETGIDDLLDSAELGLYSSNSKHKLSNKEAELALENIKQKSIDDTINGVISELCDFISKNDNGSIFEKNGSYNINFIAENSLLFFQDKIFFSDSTFKGKFRKIYELLEDISVHTDTMINEKITLKEYMKKNNDNKSNEEKLVDSYFSSKLFSRYLKMYEEVSKIDFEYKQAIKKLKDD